MLIPDLGKGGAETSFITLANYLALSHKVTVASFSKIDFQDLKGTTNILIGKGKRSNSLLGKIRDFLQRKNDFKQVLNEAQADVSISFLEGANYINALCSNKSSLTVLSVRGSKRYDQNIAGLKGKLRKRFLIPRLYKRANLIVAISEGLRRELITDMSLDEKKIICIPNAFDFDRINDLLREDIPSKYLGVFNQKTIISHGRLAPEKGYEELIDVFDLFLNEGNQAKLIIMGSGDLLEKLIVHAESKNLSCSNWHNTDSPPSSSSIHFIPHRENVYPFLKASDLYIMNSFHEGFGKALLEALYSGTNVLAKDVPYGPKEILRVFGLEENLILADSNNRNFANRIKTELSKDKSKQIDKISFNRFSIEKVMEQWNKVIEDA